MRPIGRDFEALGFGGVVGWILRFCRFDRLPGSCEPDVAVLGGDLAGWERELTPRSAYAAPIAWISGQIANEYTGRSGCGIIVAYLISHMSHWEISYERRS